MPEALSPETVVGVQRGKLEELLARLRDVTRQRDDLLSQYEAMALQVDESTKDVDGALLEARTSAKRAQDCEVVERQEAAQIAELTRQLEDERRKTGAVGADFARYRESAEQRLAEPARGGDPWSLLAVATSQILSQGVAWARAKIPADSAFLPWFDRTVAFAKKATLLTVRGTKAFFAWAAPCARDLWKRLKSEATQLLSKD